MPTGFSFCKVCSLFVGLVLPEFYKNSAWARHVGSCIAFQMIAVVIGIGASLSSVMAASSHEISFGAPRILTAESQPTFATVGDLNGDAKIDLVLVGGKSVSVMLCNGDGGFQAEITTKLEGTAVSATVGDFNSDNHQDIAVAILGTLVSPSFGPIYFDPGSVVILLGNGDGTFEAPVSYSAGNHCLFVTAGDFDRDGKLDLAVNSAPTLQGLEYPGEISVLIGNGDGTFQNATVYGVANTPNFGTTSDIDCDGNPDLIVANDFGVVSILAGNGDGSFTSLGELVSAGRPASIAVGDFDGNGKPDLAVANFDTATVSVFLGKGDGTFLPAANYPAGLNNCFSVAASDFNGDGSLDLVVADYSGATVQVLEGKNNGTFKAPETFRPGENGEWLAVGDFNDDGKPDLAVANPAGSISVMINTTGVKTKNIRRAEDQNRRGSERRGSLETSH